MMKKYRFILMVAFVSLMSISGFAKKHIHLDAQAKQAGCPIEASIEETTNDLSFEFTQNVGVTEITVISATGETVCTQIAEGAEASFYSVNLDAVPSGTYTLIITTNNRRFFGQFDLE